MVIDKKLKWNFKLNLTLPLNEIWSKIDELVIILGILGTWLNLTWLPEDSWDALFELDKISFELYFDSVTLWSVVETCSLSLVETARIDSIITRIPNDGLNINILISQHEIL